MPVFCPYFVGSFDTDFQEPVSFQIIQISSFYNRSWVQNLGSGWLDELQTHGWESSSGTIIFLWPWSKGNYSNEEWMELEKLFRMSSIGIPQMFHNLASQWQLECEFGSLLGEWGYGWEVYVFLNEFLIPLGNILHSLLNLTSPHHKTAITHF